MSESEKLEIKKMLSESMNDFIEKINEDGHSIGWLPDDLGHLMMEAAFNVLTTVHKTNEFIYREFEVDENPKKPEE